MDRNQCTLGKSVSLSGIGLHSGRTVHLEILPSSANSGILFQRTDSDYALQVPAHVGNITSTELSTTIGAGSSAVSTIEHLMAAFAGVGIDNALVKVNSPEIPIMDGSSAPFVEAFLKAGIVRQNALRRYFVVKKAFEVRDGDKFVRIEPSRRLRFDCAIDFGKGIIGRQQLDVNFGKMSFLKICHARTFCHVGEVNAMRKVGLALGGSLENAVVVGENEVLNAEGLRCDDEFVRHKLLDAIGDLALLGAPMIGKISLFKSGHTLHARFMNELLKHKDDVLETSEPKPAAESEILSTDDLMAVVLA